MYCKFETWLCNLRTFLNEPRFYYAFRKHQKANNFELLFDEFVTQAALWVNYLKYYNNKLFLALLILIHFDFHWLIAYNFEKNKYGWNSNNLAKKGIWVQHVWSSEPHKQKSISRRFLPWSYKTSGTVFISSNCFYRCLFT